MTPEGQQIVLLKAQIYDLRNNADNKIHELSGIINKMATALGFSGEVSLESLLDRIETLMELEPKDEPQEKEIRKPKRGKKVK